MSKARSLEQLPIRASGDQSLSRTKAIYRRDIDGLRAIAVTSVVAYHAGLMFFPGGYVGVDVFFVISGYLIGAHVYRDVKRERFSLAAFYQRRAKRILPALFAVLLFCYTASVFLMDASELKTFAENAVATIGSASNVLVWLKVNYFSPGANQNPLLMTWSLGVEEQFYLVFPLIMMLFAWMGRRKLLAGTLIVTVLSLLLSALGVMKYRDATFYLLPARTWELSVGVLLAIYENDRPASDLYCGGRWSNWLGLLGLMLLGYPILSYNDTTAFPGIAAGLPVMGSALILMSPSGWVNRYLLSSPPFVAIGLVSYSWYLWHWPLLSFARIVSDQTITTAVAGIIASLSLAVAWCSYRFVEQPFRRSETPTIPLLKRYAVLCGLMILPAIVTVANRGFPERCPELNAVEQRSGIPLRGDTCLVDYGSSLPNLSEHCVPLRNERPGIALLGDSHAGALGDALRKLAEEQNMKMYELTKGSCPPLLGVTRRMLNHPGHDLECAHFNEKAMEIVRRDPTIQTVWLAGFWSAPFVEESQGSRFALNFDSSPVSATESSKNLEHGLSSVIVALKKSGKRVVVVKDVPLFDFDPVRRIRLDFMPVRRFFAGGPADDEGKIGLVPRKEIESPEEYRASAIIDMAANSSAEVLDLKQSLCNEQYCQFYSDGSLLYADPQHLSLAGSIFALKGIRLDSLQNSQSELPQRLSTSTASDLRSGRAQ